MEKGLTFLREGDTVLDIGANVGWFSLRAARRVGESGRVIAFEPDPITCERMKENVRSNGLKNITIEHIGLGETSGCAMLERVNFRNSGMNRIVQSVTCDSRDMVLVHLLRMDDYCKDSHIDNISVIKIDVEGYEMKVLHGGEHTIYRHLPIIIIECNKTALSQQNESSESIYYWFHTHEYTLYDAETWQPYDNMSNVENCCDLIAVPNYY